MNKKAQAGLGEILVVFILVLVGAILLVASAQQVGDVINTVDVANDTYAGTNATNTSIAGKLWTDLVVYNVTGNAIVEAGNYTLYNNIVVNGEETARLEMNVLAASEIDYNWLISGTFQPTTYIANGGGRAVAGLIAIFFALAIAVVALEPTLRNKFLDVVKK